MNSQQLQIAEELRHAGASPALPPEALRLESLRITVDKKLEPMEFLFRLFGKPCFPRGELVAVTGKAKSGKTYLSTLLMACCTLSDVLSLHREREAVLRVLWYDTEQSDESTQDILCHRLMPLTGGATGHVDVFNVRGVSWKERRQLLAIAIRAYRPDLVIVDGIRDLVNDINDGVLAQEVMEELMQQAALSRCCITCILHQNKGSEDHNLRGWIGTELMNKAFEVYACEKLLPQRIFAVQQTLTRKYDIGQTLYFAVDDNGLPVSAKNVDAGQESGRPGALPALNQEYILHDESGGWSFDVRRLFSDALHGECEVAGVVLRERVMKLSCVSVPYKYNQLLRQALDEKIIERYERNRATFYRAAPF